MCGMAISLGYLGLLSRNPIRCWMRLVLLIKAVITGSKFISMPAGSDHMTLLPHHCPIVNMQILSMDLLASVQCSSLQTVRGSLGHYLEPARWRCNFILQGAAPCMWPFKACVASTIGKVLLARALCCDLHSRHHCGGPGRENGPPAGMEATQTTCVLYMMNPVDLQKLIRVQEASRLQAAR